MPAFYKKKGVWHPIATGSPYDFTDDILCGRVHLETEQERKLRHIEQEKKLKKQADLLAKRKAREALRKQEKEAAKRKQVLAQVQVQEPPLSPLAAYMKEAKKNAAALDPSVCACCKTQLSGPHIVTKIGFHLCSLKCNADFANAYYDAHPPPI